MQWFVKPETIRLDLPYGQWVEVKRGLNFAERERLSGAGFTGFRGPESDRVLAIDWSLFNIRKLETWLVAWSLRDSEDRPVALTPDAIANLNPEGATEILSALDRYQAVVEDEKKGATVTIETPTLAASGRAALP